MQTACSNARYKTCKVNGTATSKGIMLTGGRTLQGALIVNIFFRRFYPVASDGELYQL
jgi:hypothetical protein